MNSSDKPDRKSAVIAGTVVAGLVAIAAASAASAEAPPAKVTYHDSFGTGLPGRPSGRAFQDHVLNVSDPNAKPPATTHVHTQLPAGARYDTTAVPACTASDAEIMALGTSACPADSKVGTNLVVIDSGAPGPGRYATEDVTFFNEHDGMIIVSRDRASGAYVVLHAKVHGGSFDLDQPPLPGTPPDGGAVKSESGVLFKAVGAGERSYITTPPTCPASRIWRFHYTWTFSDRRKQTATSEQRCRRRPRHRLRVRLRGLPHHCVSSGFTARVRVAGGGAIRDAVLRLDGRRIARRRVRRFRQRVAASALSHGHHALRAVVRDRTGDTAVWAAGFVRC